jgi:hypothetical protein
MISKFSDLIAAGATGVCALAIGGAGLASRRLPRWAAWISIVVGAVDIVSGTGPAQLNLGTLGPLPGLSALLDRGSGA